MALRKSPSRLRILSFEYDRANFEKFLDSQNDDEDDENVEFIHAGLLSHSGFGEVAGSGIGGHAMAKLNQADKDKSDTGNSLITLNEFY